MPWYCFFVFFIYYFHASDLLHPRDFLTLDMRHNGKPVLIKDQPWRNKIDLHIVLFSDVQREMLGNSKEIKQIKKVPYSINNDHDDNYLVIKRNGIWSGYGYKKFNREISLLLLYLVLLKKEYYTKDVFIIQKQLYNQISVNPKFKKIFEFYGFFISRNSLKFLQQEQSKIPKKVHSSLATTNRYAYLQRVTPFKLLAGLYNFYHASLLKSYATDPTQIIVLKPANLIDKQYLCSSECYIFEKESIMLKHCQENNFSLFKMNNKDLLPCLTKDLELIDLFFQIRYAQITGSSALKNICIIEKRFKQIQSEKAFCEFLTLFNIFCLPLQEGTKI